MKKKFMMFIAVVMMLSMSAVSVSANEITGTGNVLYFEVFEVVVPTANFDFYLDPMGLLPDSAPGKIIFGSYTGNVLTPFEPVVINKSSVDIKLGVEMEITGDVDAVANTLLFDGEGEKK